MDVTRRNLILAGGVASLDAVNDQGDIDTLLEALS